MHRVHPDGRQDCKMTDVTNPGIRAGLSAAIETIGLRVVATHANARHAHRSAALRCSTSACSTTCEPVAAAGTFSSRPDESWHYRSGKATVKIRRSRSSPICQRPGSRALLYVHGHRARHPCTDVDDAPATEASASGLSACSPRWPLGAKPASAPSARRISPSALPARPRPIRQLVAKPGDLPLGVAAGVALAALGGLARARSRRQMADQPRHAVRLHGRQQRIEPARRERPHLVERAGRQHGVEARVDPAIELGAIGREKNLDRPRRIERAGMPSRCQSVSERPVASTTSSARRCASGRPASAAPPMAGSRRAARHRAARCPRPRAARAPRARISAGIGGTAASPWVSALK